MVAYTPKLEEYPTMSDMNKLSAMAMAKNRKEGIIMYKGMRFGAFVFIIASVLLGSSVAPAQGKGKGHSEKPPGWEMGEKKGWTSDVPPGIEKKGGWMPPGLSKDEQAEWKDGRPPGWSRGEKEGWEGADMPPGLAKRSGQLPPGLAKSTPPGWKKWNNAKKKQWEKELGEAREKVRGRAKKLKDFSEEDLNSALLSIEAAVRKGVPIRHALGLVEKAMEKGIKGRGIETATRAIAYGVGREINFNELGKSVDKMLDEGLRDDDLSIEIYKEVARRHQEGLEAKEAIQQEKEKGKKK